MLNTHNRTIGSLLVVALLVPEVALARHYGSYNSVNTSRLDDDIVEEMPIPVLFGVTYDEVIPDFGDPRGGGTREHEGQDFIVPLGTPVVSPTEAVVVRTGTGSSAGRYVYTANPGGETFRYMHLDSIADIDRGDVLKPGDLVGTVGDTGNAPDGVYHLHFEIRDDDNDPLDPYERATDSFALKEKASFLDSILDDVNEDKDDYAEFLVTTYGAEIGAMVRAGYDLPREIEKAFENTAAGRRAGLQAKLTELLATVPELLNVELVTGDQGAMVMLLQLYIVFHSEGPARDNLATAGATGYYGPITAAAVRELQDDVGEDMTGVYDSELRKALLD